MATETRQPETQPTVLANVVAFDPARRRRTTAIVQAAPTEPAEHADQPDGGECQFFRLDQAMVLLIHMQAEGVDARLQSRWRSAIQAALASNPFSPVVVSTAEVQAFESRMNYFQRLTTIADYCNDWLDEH